MAIYRVVIEVDEPTLDDAQDHIESLNGTDLVDEIVEVQEKKITEEIVCKQDEDVFEYTFTVTGQFYGDKDEVINKDRILDVARLTDKGSAWEMLWGAEFELTDLQEKE